MRNRNASKTLSPICLVVFSTLILFTVSHAQDVVSPVDTMTLPDRFAVPADTTTGWLILYGELVSPPYEIVVEDSNIFINGLPYYRRPKPSKTRESRLDSTGKSVYELDRKFWPLFRTHVEQEGMEAARIWASEYIGSHPVVDTAYFIAPSDLLVEYRGVGFKTIYELELRSRPKSPEGHFGKTLKFRAKVLAAALDQKSLVILNGGARSVIHAPDGEKRFIMLKDAAKIVDFRARFSTIKSIVGDSAIATSIAENFMRD